MDIEKFIQKVKEKKELKGVSDDFIRTLIAARLKKSKEPSSEKDEKIFLKMIRAELRMHTGRFHTKLSTPRSSEEELLASHSSTQERKAHYTLLNALVTRYAPHSILDVGCGLNPLIMAKPHVTYYACDIHQSEIDRINDHFKKHGITGRAFTADIRTYNEFPHADLCLVLKVLDILDTKGRSHAESLLKRLPCKVCIVSFATKKLSGKKMNRPRRYWLEKMLTRLGYTYEVHETPNEVFYCITKSH